MIGLFLPRQRVVSSPYRRHASRTSGPGGLVRTCLHICRTGASTLPAGSEPRGSGDVFASV